MFREDDLGVQSDPQGDRVLCVANRDAVNVQRRSGFPCCFPWIYGEDHGFRFPCVHVDLHVVASGPLTDAVKDGLHICSSFFRCVGLGEGRQIVGEDIHNDVWVCCLDVGDERGGGEHEQKGESALPWGTLC